ncbi:hypothetical protein ACOSP7_027798 [Xanthoceras sorbifolium]
MADSLPLLSQSDTTFSGSESHHHEKVAAAATSLDEIIEQSIGGFAWSQFFQAILVSLASIFDSQQSFISVYTDGEPTWHCINNTTCNSISSNICELPRSDWAWDGTASKTIISEWGLECSSAFIKGLPASSHFMGCLLGTIFLATLADSSLGRKNLLLLSCLTMSITTSITIFSNNVWIYSALRFLTGLSRASIDICTIVLVTEKVGRKWRGRVGLLDCSFFMVGILSLPAIAYMNREFSWRAIYLCISIPTLIHSAFVYQFVSESPRWLFMQGREKEAIEALKRISPLKEQTLLSTQGILGGVVVNPRHDDESNEANIFSSIKNLFHRKWARNRIMVTMVLSFGIGLVYYGETLGVGNLGFDIYLSVLFNGLLEIPSLLLSLFLIEKWNRKTSLLILCILSGIFSILTIVAGNENGSAQIGLELASFFGACTAYNLILIYAVELFPTSVRSFASSTVRQAITFGAMLSSLLNSAASNNQFLSYGVFGLVIICSGLFVIFLPETRDAALCDTLDEQEHNDTIVVL